MTSPTTEPLTRDAGELSLDQLIALNDEIVALVRAGFPLERGLLAVGRDLPGRLGSFTTLLAERMRNGESLPQALEAEGDRITPIYRAVVEAGLRTGRLPVALEGLTVHVRNYLELRRALALALIYPLTVLVLAYTLFVAFVTVAVPRFVAAFAAFRIPGREVLDGLNWLGTHALYWVPVLPIALLAFGLFWMVSGRARVFPVGRSAALLGWVPWMRGILKNTRAANLAGMLALLVENDVPFAEAIALAGRVTGDPALATQSVAIAERLRLGEPLGDAARASGGFPPLLLWLMITGQNQGTLVEALRHAARTYRRRALHQADLVRTLLPTILLIVIGATVTLIYTLALFLPFSTLLNQLSESVM